MSTDPLTAFLSSDFQTAESSLSSLSTSSDDPRIFHNLFITRFYGSLTQSSLDNLLFFVSSQLPTRPSTKAQFFSQVTSNPSLLKPLETQLGPVALYNVAVIAYVQGHLPAAAAISKLLYSNVEAMDDWLALKVCFLLADVHLRVNEVTTASTATSYADRLLQWSTKGESNSLPDMPRLAPDWPGRATATLGAPVTQEDAKFCLHIYNARLGATGEGAKNRKEAKSAVLAADDSETRPTSAALLVKARLEGSLSKGLRILASIGGQSPPKKMKKVMPLALNSLGVLHHRLGRHALAACYFEEARRAFAELFGESGGVAALSGVRDSNVCYNLALQYIKLGDYGRALELLSVAARKDATLAESSALLWIRMAECCVGVDSSGKEDRHILGVEGTGRGRRLVMRMEPLNEGLAMEYASTCARGAIAVLNKRKSQAAGGSPRKVKRPSLVETRQEPLDDEQTEAIQVEEDNQLRGAALCLLAYSSLSFDPHAVIDACDELNGLYPQSENERALLGRLYAAEALCQLGRADEAANRLAPLLAVSESSDSNLKEAACINMALSHVSSGDINAATRAAKIALKVTTARHGGNSLHKQATFVAAYVFLRGGEVDSAKQILRSLHSNRE